MTRIFSSVLILVSLTLSSFCVAEVTTSQTEFFDYAKEKVNKAIKGGDIWDGPTTGPSIVQSKNIIFVASDLRNGGVYGVGKGMSEA